VDIQCGNCSGVGGFNPPLSVFNSLVALVYLSWGSDVTPTDHKNVKNTKFLVNTWVFKAKNAPKPVHRWGSLRRYLRPHSWLIWGTPPLHSPPSQRLRHLDFTAFGASLPPPLPEFSSADSQTVYIVPVWLFTNYKNQTTLLRNGIQNIQHTQHREVTWSKPVISDVRGVLLLLMTRNKATVDFCPPKIIFVAPKL